MTVEENLSIGGYTRRDPDGVRRDMKMIYDYFPGWWSAAASSPATCRAASSRCW